MLLTLFKSKLHQMSVTEANLFYEGSITIDEELLELAELLPYEKVQVVNINNGSRLETYTIPGPRGSRICCLNGPAARLAQVKDRVIIISYAQMTPEEAKSHKPKVVIVDKNNDPIDVMNYSVYANEIIPED
ncbi:aspartate 1-decarboxylase [bacterium]|nr:MAG: aspartate 1-decarboxylase [bacterium]